MNKYILVATAALLFAVGRASVANAQSVTYQATFKGQWTTEVSPGGVPGGVHFTTLIGAVHNSQVTFWRNGETASPGMEDMAELGLTSALRGEIESRGSDVLATLQQGISSGGTASATIEFSATPTHSLVTLVTMVAPSPDWFTGVSGFSLRENGEWIGSRTVDLFPYDAGTEDGEEFSLSNPPTSPQGVITLIRGMGKFSDKPIATLTFTLQTRQPDPDPDPDPTPAPPALSTDASLSGLTGRAGADDPDSGGAITLIPDFAPDTANYAAVVPHAVTGVTLTPTVNDPGATVKVGPQGGMLIEVVSGAPAPEISLAVGENVIEIEITAEDGVTSGTYLVTVTRRAAPVPLDAAAAREHLFPLLADGDGFHSRLFLNDVSASENRCALELRGAGLDAARFEEHAALTVSDAGIHIELDAADAGVALATAGTGALSFGYAKLACAHPAVARMLLILESGGAPAAMTALESAHAQQAFEFPIYARFGRLGLVLANGNAQDASCALEVETADGASAGGANLTVPARSTVSRFLDELTPMRDGATGGIVAAMCDRPVAALGVPFDGGAFTVLKSFVRSPVDPEDNGESRQHRLLPLVLDGEGFRSHLLLTNLSEEISQCTVRLHGAGMNTARFENVENVTKDGFSQLNLELPGHGGRVEISSLGRHALAFGYAALDCDAPVDVRNLLTSHTAEGIGGMAVVAPGQSAREVRFPVALRLEGLGLALVLTNAAASEASCEAALVLTGQEDMVAAKTPVRVAGAATVVQFLTDLFELPEDFAGGEARLSCDGEVAAVSLPFAGSVFAAMPPVLPGFDAAPE